MIPDIQQFYEACYPGNNEQQYQLNYSPVRGSRVMGAMKETICRSSLGEATCQLFTGYIGTGKTTELLHLKTKLEQELFHVVYFDARDDLDLTDVDIDMLMLAIAHRIGQSLELSTIEISKGFCNHLLSTVSQLPETFATCPGLDKLIPALKNSVMLRNHLRQVLANHNYNFVEAINEQLLVPAIAHLNRQGKKGLVIIIDGLDRLENARIPWGRRQYENIFIHEAHQLRQLNCHAIYTFPLDLVFSNKYTAFKQSFSVAPIVLPLIPVQRRDGSDCEEGMELLRQMVLVRAFPKLDPEERLDRITEIFDSPETLNRLCRMSGGNVRMLQGMLYRCLQEAEPPLSRHCIEVIVRECQLSLVDAVDAHEWGLLVRVAQQHSLTDKAADRILWKSGFVLEYRDDRGRWFNVNPLLMETEQLQTLMY